MTLITKEISTSREVFVTDDRSVIKIIHDDDSETAIKLSVSHSQSLNPLTGKIEDFKSERDKYSVFISASVGCFMKCPFCHLTIKNAKFQKLSRDEILLNLKSALTTAVASNPDLKNKYIKLSWMGMGEAIVDPEGVKEISLAFLDWVFANKLAVGLDGIDLATVMPNIKNMNLDALGELNQELYRYPLNPKNNKPDNVSTATFNTYAKRTPFRLFYSLHAIAPETRDFMVPGAMPLDTAVQTLNTWSNKYDCNLIIHQLILDGRNDSWPEIESLVAFFNKNLKEKELRILRYNVCARATEKETEHFNELVKYLSDNVELLKVQVSPGKEVSAACGQFIVRKYVDNCKTSKEPS